jgi:hypothetical protein
LLISLVGGWGLLSDRLLSPGSDFFQFSKGTGHFIEATVGTCEEKEFFNFFKSGALLSREVPRFC